MNRWRNFARVE